jgi:ubiquinone/menaquinone biosynthesis C-methylase UbiE
MTATVFQDHFSEVAKRYAGFRPHYPAALFDWLATLAPRSSTVWDCACGNGQATVDLAERFERVIATDGSADQIAAAAQHPRVEYRVAVAERSGLPDASVGLVTVAQALHWFDLPRFYAEAGRVSKPGGLLAVWSYGVNDVEGDAVNAIVQDYYSNVVGPYWPPERKLVEDGYRTIPFPLDEVIAPPFRIEADWTMEQLLGYFSSWSATNRYMKATGRQPLEPLAATLAEAWGDTNAPRRVTWPLTVRVGRLAG